MLNSLLLFFNLGKKMISPGVTAFRLVDSLFACVFRKFLVYSVVVEFLPLVYSFSAGLYHILKYIYIYRQNKSQTHEEHTNTQQYIMALAIFRSTERARSSVSIKNSYFL